MEEIKQKDLFIKVASSNLKIEDLIDIIRKTNTGSTVIQIFDPGAVISRLHIAGAYANASFSFKNHSNKTKSVGMEMLLFAAMTDQIGDAIETAGAKDSSRFIIFSNRKSLPESLKKEVKISSDFNSSALQARKTAKLMGITGKDVDVVVLQAMALSRLTSD